MRKSVLYIGIILFLYSVSYGTPPVTICQLGSNTPGIIGLWHMNEGAGASVANVIDSNYSGSLVNATFVAGKFSSCLTMAGNAYAECGDDPNLDLTEELTICAWIKPDIPNIGIQEMICSKYNDAVANKGYWFWVAGFDNDKLAFSSRSAAGSNNTYGSSMAAYDDIWVFVCATFTGGDTTRLYINGELDTGPITVTGIDSPTGGDFMIGTLSTEKGNASFSWNGEIDDLAVYNRAMPDAEIYHLYHRNPRSR